MAALLDFVVFIVAIVLSFPIAESMILGALAPIMTMGKGGSIAQLLNNAFSGANSTPILAVPLFILGGIIMAEGGISKKLFNFFAYFIGKLRGGIPCAVILTCLFYGAILYVIMMVNIFCFMITGIRRHYSAIDSFCSVFTGYRRLYR